MLKKNVLYSVKCAEIIKYTQKDAKISNKRENKSKANSSVMALLCLK